MLRFRGRARSQHPPNPGANQSHAPNCRAPFADGLSDVLDNSAKLLFVACLGAFSGLGGCQTADVSHDGVAYANGCSYAGKLLSATGHIHRLAIDWWLGSHRAEVART